MLYIFIRIALTTGMRSAEIAGLRWEQIDFEAGVVTVGRKAKTRQGSGRQIPMHGDLRLVIDAHAAWYADGFGELRPEWFVFPGRRGKPTKGIDRPMDPACQMQSINSSWDRIRGEAKVSCRFHDLRHTVATKLAESGVPESTMLSLLGHMSRAMLERYSHIRMKAKRAAVESLGLRDLSYSKAGSNGGPQRIPTSGASTDDPIGRK